MGTIYCCSECGANLNLHAAHLFPSDFYFEAGNKNSLSFSAVDYFNFRFEKEDKIIPFFETVNYWGIQRKRTKIKCNSCGELVGYIYDDGPPLTNGIGQFGFGPSQVVPRNPRSQVAPSVTKQDIANYWKQRGIKAVARIRNSCRTMVDMVKLLKDEENSIKASSKDNENEDVRVGGNKGLVD